MSIDVQNDVQNDEQTKKVLGILKDVLQLPEEPPYDSNLVFYGLDSITAVNLIVDIESEFQIMFDNDDLLIDNFATVEKIVNMIRAKQGRTT